MSKFKKSFYISSRIIILCVICCICIRNSKITIEEFGDVMEQTQIGEIEYSNSVNRQLEMYSKETTSVYYINDFQVNKRVKDNINKYKEKKGLDVEFNNNGITMSMLENNKEDSESVLTEEQVNNSKEWCEDAVKEILDLLEIKNINSIDSFHIEPSGFITYVDESGDEKKNQPTLIKFFCDIPVTKKYRNEGNAPSLYIFINNKGDVCGVEYCNFNFKSIYKKYKFKTAKEIEKDIRKERNVLVESVYGGTGDESFKGWSDVVIDDIKVVMYFPINIEDNKYIVPYYIITGHNKRKDEIMITMPAIKDKYLRLNKT
ncbi:MAG: hypothetical protein E7262_10055 [Lachnospiraceae bacterium]|nr:hypothetical protein [Lachnospiraceae bacterium]